MKAVTANHFNILFQNCNINHLNSKKNKKNIYIEALNVSEFLLSYNWKMSQKKIHLYVQKDQNAHLKFPNTPVFLSTLHLRTSTAIVWRCYKSFIIAKVSFLLFQTFDSYTAQEFISTQ